MIEKEHHLSQLTIEHFKSFGPSTTISFGPGFNVIVGSNGSGKSNSLDAILFALAQDPHVLRVRSWSELANRARRGPCCVRLAIAPVVSPGDADVALVAHAKEDSVRPDR